MNKVKFSLFVAMNIINYVLVLFSVLFYTLGYRVFPIFICTQLALTVVNHAVSENLKQQGILSINLLISTIAANILLTFLYMNNISADSGTLLVGKYAVVIGIIFVALSSLIAMSIKYKTNKKKQ